MGPSLHGQARAVQAAGLGTRGALGTSHKLRSQSFWYRERETQTHPAREHRHTPTCAHACTHSCTHTCGGHVLRVCPARRTPPSPALPPAVRQLRSRGRGWPPATAPSLPPERETAQELGRGGGVETWTLGNRGMFLAPFWAFYILSCFLGNKWKKYPRSHIFGG